MGAGRRGSGRGLPVTDSGSGIGGGGGLPGFGRAVDVTLPLRFMVAGVLAFGVGLVWLNLRPGLLVEYHYNQTILGLTHLLVLGWVGSVVMGALYQLVPVALEVPLHRERWIRWHFWLHAVGVVGMVWMFAAGDYKQVGHFGSLVALGIGLMTWNLVKTLFQVRRWTAVAVGLAASVGWLVLAAGLGLFAAATKCWPIAPFDPIAQMHAHAHLGLMGGFLGVTLAVSLRLVPMFLLSGVQSGRRAMAALIIFHVGVGWTVLAILFQHPSKVFGALLVASGLVVHGLEMRAIVRARRKVSIDGGVAVFLVALGSMAWAVVVGLGLSVPGMPVTRLTTQLETVYGLAGVFGVLSLGIMGMLMKILPFLVWYRRYSPLIGRAKVPALAGLFSARIQQGMAWCWCPGLVAVMVGSGLSNPAWVRGGLGLMLAGAALFGCNVVMVLRHWMMVPVVGCGETGRGAALGWKGA